MILTKYHALFVIFEKAAKFEIVFCCKLYVHYGLMKCLLGYPLPKELKSIFSPFYPIGPNAKLGMHFSHFLLLQFCKSQDVILDVGIETFVKSG